MNSIQEVVLSWSRDVLEVDQLELVMFSTFASMRRRRRSSTQTAEA